MKSYGTGRTAVITHGVQTVADHWAEVANRLPGRTLVPNRRGRGESVPIGDDYELATEVADLHRVLDQAGPEPVLIGHSYGGMIALLAAAERDDLAGLVLYDPTVPVDGPVTGDGLDVMRAALKAGDRDTAFATVLTRVVGEYPEDVEGFRTGDPAGWAGMLELIDSTYAELSALDRLAYDPSLLAKVTAPTWVIVGERSDREELVFGRAARALVDGIADARLVVLPGQGHVAHVADPDALADAIRPALKGF
ncbi:alpha/beta hydrolase [Micromonospora sp. WMMD882]|uniref:alpha/beta fold hydrolase n=1 Tax=Micromonospora sp. WMMD882 TaxID=3015151 RepID=UPI00248D309E|nr:alpha/beta hydrolase [Micromonospora sp. WMMD882]WBB80509.1 alpha/beta hydrolase [Micromonospora sp. WMMD882]